jgi:hypothetical protein
MNRRGNELNGRSDYEDDPQVKRRLEEAAERAKDQEMKVIQLEKEIENLKASGGSSSDRLDQQKHGSQQQQSHGITGGMKDTFNKGKDMGKNIVGGVKDKFSGYQTKSQGQSKNRGRDQDDDDDDYDGGNRKESRDRSRGHKEQDYRR